MATNISWADESWNPIIGCSKISEGCANCYAEKMACRLAAMGNEDYECVVRWAGGTPQPNSPVAYCEKPVAWHGNMHFVESALTKPLHWRKPRKVFVCSMSDLFLAPFEWIDRVFAVMALCPQHRFMCLTKRAGRMREYFTENEPNLLERIFTEAHDMLLSKYEGDIPDKIENAFLDRWETPLTNLHLGVTIENQANVGRLVDLSETPAANHFVSLEPLLERVKFEGLYASINWCGFIDYAFIGCESGPKARLCTLQDIQYQMIQCQSTGVKIHIKQIPLNGKCNKNIEEWPKEFQIREE